MLISCVSGATYESTKLVFMSTTTTAAAATSRVGSNLVLASLLSLLSYVPFEVVAKASFAVCVYLFIVDPFSPLSRLISLVSLVVLAVVSRAHRNWTIHNDNQEFYVRHEQHDEDQEQSLVVGDTKKDY